MRSITTQKEQPPGRFAFPYFLIGVILLVGICVAYLTYNTIQQNRKEYVRLYKEKGASLITSVEAGVRTDLRSKNSTIRLKLLLEEMADRPDIFFIAITFSDGSIMQSTFEEGQGHLEQKFLRQIKKLPLDDTGNYSQSVIYDTNNRQVFLAYRKFAPLTKQELQQKLQDEPTLEPLKKFLNLFRKDKARHPMVANELEGYEPYEAYDDSYDSSAALVEDIGELLQGPEDEKDQPVIYVGLDARPLQELQRSSLVQTVVTTGSALLLAIFAVISLYWVQHAQRFRRRAGRSKAMVKEVMYNLPDGLIVTDSADQIVYMNELSRVLLSCDGAMVAGTDVAQVLLSDLVPFYIKARDGELRSEQLIETSTEKIPLLPLGINGSAILDEQKKRIGTVFLMRDLREVRNLQAEVQRKDKLAAIGSLAAGVAHEIRNPLSSIKGGATYLKKQFLAGSAGERTASIVIDEVERLNRVISDLIGLSRPSDLTLRPVVVTSILTHCLELIKQEAEIRDVKLVSTLSQEIPPTMLDADRFSQVVLNLCLNSLDAMEEGGTLTVSVSTDHNATSIIIEDTGEGMDAKTRDRIFEPYFTTKSHGTGLGLSVVHKIIEAHNGIIRVFSQKGKGTRFVIQLPSENKE